MISIFIATSGRPGMFRDMLQSLRDTTQGYDVEVVAVIDDDFLAYTHALDYQVEVIDYSHTRRGALNAWNLGLQLSNGQHFVPAGDDQLFHQGWLGYALDAHRTRVDGFGVVGMNDLAYKPPQVATMWLFDRKFCKEVMGGIFAPPCYKYYNIDSEWNEKAKTLGKFYWCEESKVEHLHSAHGKRPVDATDALKDESWMERDRIVFEDRQARGFPIEWESLI